MNASTKPTTFEMPIYLNPTDDSRFVDGRLFSYNPRRRTGKRDQVSGLSFQGGTRSVVPESGSTMSDLDRPEFEELSRETRTFVVEGESVDHLPQPSNCRSHLGLEAPIVGWLRLRLTGSVITHKRWDGSQWVL